MFDNRDLPADSIAELEKKNIASVLLNLIRKTAANVVETFLKSNNYEIYYNMTITAKRNIGAKQIIIGEAIINDTSTPVTSICNYYEYDVHDKITGVAFENLQAKCMDDINIGDLVRVYVGNDYKYIGFKF